MTDAASPVHSARADRPSRCRASSSTSVANGPRLRSGRWLIAVAVLAVLTVVVTVVDQH